jgi:hypothetical protein
MVINESISTFVHNATRLGATSVASANGAFMNLIEENVFHRMNTTQDEDSGHRILRDPAGKVCKSHRILQESTGSGSSIPAGTFFR